MTAKIEVTVQASGYFYGADDKWERTHVWASAEVDGAHYHVNLGRDGVIPTNRPMGSKRQPFRILYKNPTVNKFTAPGSYTVHPDYFETKSLDIDAAANKRFREAFEAAITPEAIEAAHVKVEADERAKLAAEAKADSDRLRAGIAGEIDRLRLEGKGQVAHDLQTAFADLNDDQVRRLANIIRNS